jgi:predicted Rossmann fold flavoprotein
MSYDAIILGAGGAGLMCALSAGRRARKILVLDHSAKMGGKILISGGGRCNFTNLSVGPENFVSRNPDFCKTVLKNYPPQQFINLVKKHSIKFHEKKLGQLFCDHSAREIVQMLRKECELSHVQIKLECKINKVEPADSPTLEKKRGFKIHTSQGIFEAHSLVVATGGLSIPQIGASGLGYDIAKQFGHRIIPRHPALDGFLFSESDIPFFAALSGLSVDCLMTAGNMSFRENLLFTHKGLSGPAALQCSLHWNIGEAIQIDLLPEFDAEPWLLAKKKSNSKQMLKNILAERLPARFAEAFMNLKMRNASSTITLMDMNEDDLKKLAHELKNWTLHPKSTIGYNKAEVTRGGIDTTELNDTTLESLKVPGLYFIGEVVDVTGWLGGYNFQWAWASGWASAQAL